MRTLVMLTICCLICTYSFGQFFYTTTKPDEKYLIEDVRFQYVTSENIAYNSGDQSLSLAAWVDLSEWDCDGFAFGTNEIYVNVVKQSGKYKIQFSLKDSLGIEGRDFNVFTESDLFSPAKINTHIAVTYSGTSNTSGMSIYVNGVEVERDNLYTLGKPVFSTGDFLKVGSSSCKLKLYNLSSYSYDLTAAQVNTLFTSVDAQIGTPSKYITGTDAYKQSGFFDNIFQKWKIPRSGRVVSIPVWGDEANSSLDYRSPIGGGVFYAPFILYNSDQNKSYIGTGARGGPGFARGYYIASFDHTNNNLQIDKKIDGASPLIQDYHHTSTIVLGKDSSLIQVSEKTHSGDTYIYKQSNYEGEFEKIDSITGGTLAYTQPFYIGSNLFVIGRKQYDQNTIYKSIDDGDSWGSANTVTDLDAGDWAYLHTYPHGDSIVYFGCINRNQSAGGEYDQIFLLKSTDGENFCNISGSRCEDITIGVWDINELKAHAAIDSTTNGTNSVVFDFSMVDTSGRFHTVYNNGQTSAIIHAMYDGGWTYDTIETPIVSRFSVLVYKGGDSFDVWQITDEGDTEKVTKKTTTDNFLSFGDTETMFVNNYSDNGRMLLNVTQNQGQNVPVIIATSVNVDDIRQQSALWIYEYNPWE
jgi:hypothetical protein